MNYNMNYTIIDDLKRPDSFSQQTQAQRAETLARALSGMFSPVIPSKLYLPTDSQKGKKEENNG